MAGSSRTTETVVRLAAFVIAYAVMRSLGAGNDIRILSGALAGVLLTLPPYAIARRKRLPRFGGRSLAAGAVVGAVGGALFVLPLTIVLTIVAARKPAAQAAPHASARLARGRP